MLDKFVADQIAALINSVVVARYMQNTCEPADLNMWLAHESEAVTALADRFNVELPGLPRAREFMAKAQK